MIENPLAIIGEVGFYYLLKEERNVRRFISIIERAKTFACSNDLGKTEGKNCYGQIFF